MTFFVKKKQTLRSVSLIALLAAVSHSAAAESAENSYDTPEKPETIADGIKSFVEDAKPIFNSRLRYSFADFGSLDRDANGLTYRLRAGVESGSFFGTKLLVDMEYTESLSDQFNSTVNGRTRFPVVADPDNAELNRLQLVNTSIPDTKITFGRQRIIQDDARFIGNVGWRQNEQTYDALRLENSSIDGLKLDLTYVDQVNRIFGGDSPQGVFESDSWLLHAAYTIPSKDVKAKIKAYAYLLDFDSATAAAAANRLSTETYGATVDVNFAPFSLLASYATQTPYGDSTLDYSADYYTIAGKAKFADNFTASVGYEVLGSDNGFGFVTPLATAHKFNGFADLFLGTPANGLQDAYAGLDFTKKGFGPFGLLKAAATFHQFNSDVNDIDYGDEFDFLLVSTFKALPRFKYLLKLGHFNAADGFAQDVTRLTLQVEFVF